MQPQSSPNNLQHRQQQPKQSLFEYDVAISYVDADREYAEGVAVALRDYDIRVLLDAFQRNDIELIACKLYDNLTDAYLRKVRLFLPLLSEAYTHTPNMRLERHAVESAAGRPGAGSPYDVSDLRDIYIVAVEYDNVPVPAAFRNSKLVPKAPAHHLARMIAAKFKRE